MPAATVISTITVTIDGKQVAVPPGTTLYDAARSAGIDIPVLCHSPQLQPVAVCRLCVVEVQGARVLQAACIRQTEDGMVVQTQSDTVTRSRAMLTELLMADYPPAERGHNGQAQRSTGKPNLLLDLAAQQGIPAPRFPGRPVAQGRDGSSAVIQVNHDACIMCDRCIRACDDVQCNDVIGRAGIGRASRPISRSWSTGSGSAAGTTRGWKRLRTTSFCRPARMAWAAMHCRPTRGRRLTGLKYMQWVKAVLGVPASAMAGRGVIA